MSGIRTTRSRSLRTFGRFRGGSGKSGVTLSCPFASLIAAGGGGGRARTTRRGNGGGEGGGAAANDEDGDGGPRRGTRLALGRMESPSQAAAFLTRNAVDALPAGALERKLEAASREGRRLRVKLGLDPTAADIHLGHTVVLQKLREFQDLGHTVVLIVGDFTARVGDPSGRTTTRPVLSGAEIDANARTYQEQAFRVIRDDPDLYELRFNSEWLDMPMEELFRLARTATVAQMLERDDFAKRLAARAPISVLELLYPLMQGYDSVAVRADVELGGTDQTFNLLLARDVQRAYGVPEQTILTVP